MTEQPISGIGRTERRLRMGLAVWFVLSAFGVGILLIPDDGLRLFSLSETHYVTVVDGVGIVLLVVGWVSYLVPLWTIRDYLMQRRLWGLLAFLGGAVVAWSVLTDTGAWWAAGILILVLVQIAPALALLGEARKRGETSLS